MRLPLYILGALALAGPTARAEAGGFYIPEIGARASAMGGAATAATTDASAVIHNPAAMSGQAGTRVSLGGLLAMPAITYFRRPVDDPGSGASLRFDPVNSDGAPAIVPFVAALSDVLGHGLSIGLAVHAPFGASLAYPESGAQRHVVTSIRLKTIFVGPALAYRITEQLSVGATLDYIHSDLSIGQKNALQFVTGDPEAFPDPAAEVEGKTSIEAASPFALGSRIGLLYAEERFAVGVALRIPVSLKMKGRGVVENSAITPLLDAAGAELQPAGRRTDDLSIELPLPLILSVGTRFNPVPWLTIALDATWQRWSSFDRLTVDFDHELELLPTPGATLSDVTSENRWRDAFSLRLGVEAEPLDSLPLCFRAGALFDQSPIDDRHFDLLAPDSDKVGLSGGLGAHFELATGIALQLDVAFTHLFFAERSIAPSDVKLAGSMVPIPGTDKTILNKSAPSFYYGVTRSRAELLTLSVGLRL